MPFVLGLATTAHAAGGPTVNVTYPASLAAGPLDGRLLLLLSTDDKEEPRFQISDTELGTQQVFGIDVDGWKPGAVAVFAPTVVGYPVASLAAVPPGTYNVQAVLHRYETFRRSDGHTVKLPMDRGEGQQWSRAPGNLYSTPRKVAFGPAGAKGPITIALDKTMPEIKAPADTKYVKHDRIRSERLSKFWGRDMYLGAHVLLPEGWDTHPEARYPLVINHGHFPADFGGFRPDPPDPDLKCERSERFGLDCYNKTVQEHAHQFYKEWTGPNFPRVLIVEIQHANPYYDDSYAVNSANVGPYGDAITYELIPYLEQKYRGLGAGWARFMYGGSTGGWEAMAAQVFYPDEYNGAWIACPDPIDFRANTVMDIYKDENAYYSKGPWRTVERPSHRNSLGHVSSTIEQANRMEAVLGDKTRSGGQWDVWEAVYSPVGTDGYPQRLWNKQTGVIDKKVAEQWKSFDLMHIVRRDWEKGLGEKLRGKLFLYVGDMDNYYLNDAVYLAEDFFKTTTNPPYEGVVDYGDRAEHCWNGDHTRPNALSRLRYHQMFVPKIVERIAKSAPAGADVTSWKY
ncbi:MAG: hypothetical protein ABW221_18565 [Vicinamibacteria bacterium]